MPYLDTPALRFHVQELGPPDGAPVVMFHGLFSGNLAAWYFSSAPAVAATHRVRLVDLRGHGLTERPATGYDRQTMIGDALAVTADLDPFVAVGHSYGALLALRLANAHPDRVAGLVLVDPPLGTGSRERGRTADRWVASLARAAESGDSSEGIDPDGRQADQGEAKGPAGQVDALLAETSILADLDAEEPIGDAELRAPQVPMLFLFGRDSAWAPGADRVRRVRPDVDCRVLAGGHDLQLDNKAEVTAAITTFLATLPTPHDLPPERGVEEVHEVEEHEEVPYG